MRVIKQVLEGVYNNSELRKSIVPLFIGNPGLGKTVMIDEFAKEKGVTLVELITSQMSPFEISGIAMPDKDTKQMMYYNFDKLENLKDGDILFFDELLNGNPIVLNACLTILEQRKFISGKPLPDIMIVAAANPQGMVPLTPQIKERFVWYNVKYDEPMWVEYMMKKYSVTKTIGKKLSGLITNESFSSNNFNTPRSLDKAVNMMVNGVPTPYTDNVHTILSENVKNVHTEDIDLGNGNVLAPNEMMPWIDIIKHKKGIFVKKESVDEIKLDPLPKKWYIHVTLDNFDEIDNYYKHMYTSTWRKIEGYALSDNHATNYWSPTKPSATSEYKEITLEQFRTHLLKK